MTRNPIDPKYLAWVRTLPCVVCGKRAEAHHAGDHGMGQKPPDRTAIPLCRFHHQWPEREAAHTLGKRFWGFHGIERDRLIERLNACYEETGPVVA